MLAVDLAVQFVPGCDHAGISIVDGSRTVTGASSDRVVRRGDALQNELDEGPCLDSVRTHDTVISQDLSRDPRWPRWSPMVISEFGVHSMLSLLLYTTKRSYGSLNLYGDRTQAFDSESLAVAQALAAHLAVAVAASRGDRPPWPGHGEPDRDRPSGGDLDGAARLDPRTGLRLSPAPVAANQPQADRGLRRAGQDPAAHRRHPDRGQDASVRSSGPSMSSRNLVSNRVRSRDTCIWVVPISRAISAWDHNS